MSCHFRSRSLVFQLKSGKNLFSRDILQKIADNETGWEEMLPEGIAELIKDYRLFGYTRKPLVLPTRRKKHIN